MNYDEKAAKVCATLRSIRQHAEGGYDDNRSFIGTVAQALREAAAEAYEDIEKRAQIEVNACRHHAKAVSGRVSAKSLHEAAAGVADVIVRFCKESAAALRSSGQPGEGAKL